MFSPHWSPDGQFIIASPLDISKINLFDVKTQSWSTIYNGTFADAAWSSDSRFLYLLRYASNPAVLKIPARGGNPEVVADLKGFRYAGTFGIMVWAGSHRRTAVASRCGNPGYLRAHPRTEVGPENSVLSRRCQAHHRPCTEVNNWQTITYQEAQLAEVFVEPVTITIEIRGKKKK